MADIMDELTIDLIFQQVWFSLQFYEGASFFLERKGIRELIYHHFPLLNLSNKDTKRKGVIYPQRVFYLKAEDEVMTRLLKDLM